MKKQCESNRKAWNAAAEFHQKAMAKEWLEGFTKNGYVTFDDNEKTCLLYTSPSPRDKRQSRMPSSA